MGCRVLWKRYHPWKPATLLKSCANLVVVMDIWVSLCHQWKVEKIKYLLYFFLIVCSGFTRLYSVATASETYEGENTVLWLQVARLFEKINFSWGWLERIFLFRKGILSKHDWKILEEKVWLTWTTLNFSNKRSMILVLKVLFLCSKKFLLGKLLLSQKFVQMI